MRRLVVIVAALTLSACQTPMQTGSQCVVGPGFLSGQSTFTWRAASPLDVDDRTGYVSPLMQKGLTQAVLNELAGKGFSFVERVEGDPATTEQIADIEVALTLRTRRESGWIQVRTRAWICARSVSWPRTCFLLVNRSGGVGWNGTFIQKIGMLLMK